MARLASSLRRRRAQPCTRLALPVAVLGPIVAVWLHCVVERSKFYFHHCHCVKVDHGKAHRAKAHGTSPAAYFLPANTRSRMPTTDKCSAGLVASNVSAASFWAASEPLINMRYTGTV